MTQDNGMTAIECDCQLLTEECEYKSIQIIQRDNVINDLRQEVKRIPILELEIEAWRDKVASLVAEVEELRRT